MAYTEEQEDEIFARVCELIKEGKSLRQIFREEDGLFDIGMFYDLLKVDESKYQQYARATEIRADKLFDEILDIADESGKDLIIGKGGISKPNPEEINRSRLRVDARKWILSKMIPKKYGDRVDHDITSKGESITGIQIVDVDGTPI